MLRILTTLTCAFLSGFSANPAFARAAHVKVQRIHTSVVKLDGIDMRLRWAEGAPQGSLEMRVGRLQAPSIAGDYKQVLWRCTLRRIEWKAWRCSGPISMPGTAAANFSLDYRPEGFDLGFKKGQSSIQLQRRSRAPDLTSIELQALPVAWAREFIRRGWKGGQLSKGELGGQLSLRTPGQGEIEISGPLKLSNAALSTTDNAIIAENINVAGVLNYTTHNAATTISLEGTVLGDMLAGNTFVSVQGTPAQFGITAHSMRDGWNIKRVALVDGQTLRANGALEWTDAGVRNMDIRFVSTDARLLRDRYLSGWLAPIGLSDVELTGGLEGRVFNQGNSALSYEINPNALNIAAPDNRFVLTGLDGSVSISQGAAVESRLKWKEAKGYGLSFGAGDLPFISSGGELALREPAFIPIFDGRLRFDSLRIRPPQGERGLGLRFALGVENIDFGALSQAIGLPAFRGRLNGQIPNAVYENEILVLDGGLGLGVFDGRVAFSSLSVERPFGTAPTLVTNIDFERLDLLRLTEVLGFGSITGRLSGSIHDLRLIEWSPVRFDAEMHTVKTPGVKQRISQTAVKNISSVGGSSPASGLQAKALALFKDFGYSRIGIRCKLVNSVCMMSGVEGDSTAGSGSDSFTILQGAGIPRLTVIGHNRRVDWPVLVERLKAVAAGEVKPVIEH